MKTIICKKLGSVVSITVGNVYTIIGETEDRYTIVNDKGVQANYGKNLFNDPVEVPEPGAAIPGRRRGPGRPPRQHPNPQAAVPEAPRVIPTIDSIEVHTSAQQDGANISFNIRFEFMNGFHYTQEIRNVIQMNGISASCGIQSLSGLNELSSGVERVRGNFMTYVNDHRNDFVLSQNIDINNLFEEIPVALIQDLVATFQGRDADVQAAILIMSTTENDIQRHPQMRRALDRMDPNNIAANNPNSGNNIIMWNLPVEA